MRATAPAWASLGSVSIRENSRCLRPSDSRASLPAVSPSPARSSCSCSPHAAGTPPIPTAPRQASADAAANPSGPQARREAIDADAAALARWSAVGTLPASRRPGVPACRSGRSRTPARRSCWNPAAATRSASSTSRTPAARRSARGGNGRVRPRSRRSRWARWEAPRRAAVGAEQRRVARRVFRRQGARGRRAARGAPGERRLRLVDGFTRGGGCPSTGSRHAGRAR